MEDVFELTFKVRKIIFRDSVSNFSIVQAKILSIPDEMRPDEKNTIVKGTFERVEQSDTFKCFASWTEDNKYGKQIAAHLIVMAASSDLDGIRRYLKRFIPGCGAQTANKLVEKYGTDTIAKIKESPANISCIKGISEKKAELIHNKVVESDKIEGLSVFLFKHGVVSFADVVNVFSALGEDAETKIRSNPYSICDNMSISKLPLADKIALDLGFPESSPIRIGKMIIFYLSTHAYSSGDMYIMKSFLIRTLPSYMKKCNFRFNCSTEEIESALSYMQDAGSIVIENSSDDPDDSFVYLKPLYIIETQSVACIQKMNTGNTVLSNEAYNSFAKDYGKKTGIILDEIQLLAVKNAYENRFSLLTGGPGTGKTLTINAIISFLKSKNPRAQIALCAPTGRAAKRMSEATGLEACTIHRLLKIAGGDDLYSDASDTDLDATYVICDESSMLDAPLFFKLVTAVSKTEAGLLLVGDVNQLPPIGVGFPFKDLVDSNKVPMVVLEKLFRQASLSQINTNAKKILAGVTQIGSPGLSFDHSKQDFFLFDTCDVPFIKKIIVNAIDQIMALGVSLDDIIVLSPTRKLELGVESLNRLIQDRFNPPKPGVDEYHGKLYTFRVGDKVMQIKNDYDLGVFNGDIGKIKEIDSVNEKIIVEYDDFEILGKSGDVQTVQIFQKEVVYDYMIASSLELAYSTTVHKSQGAEYPVVIMPLSLMFCNLSRNILYTAVTRAKSRFVFVGDSQALISGIQKNDNAQRRTRLAERI